MRTSTLGSPQWFTVTYEWSFLYRILGSTRKEPHRTTWIRHLPSLPFKLFAEDVEEVVQKRRHIWTRLIKSDRCKHLPSIKISQANLTILVFCRTYTSRTQVYIYLYEMQALSRDVVRSWYNARDPIARRVRVFPKLKLQPATRWISDSDFLAAAMAEYVADIVVEASQLRYLSVEISTGA